MFGHSRGRLILKRCQTAYSVRLIEMWWPQLTVEGVSPEQQRLVEAAKPPTPRIWGQHGLGFRLLLACLQS